MPTNVPGGNQPQEIIIPQSLDQLFENLPIGSVRKAMGNNLFGINFRQTSSMVPSNRDMYGFTFFTRPQLNLDLYNVSNYRGFYNLLNNNPNSYQRYVRLMLDPRLCDQAFFNTMVGSVAAGSDLRSPFVDPEMAFIPILTNNIISVSGWPDLTVPTFTSAAGLYGEEYTMVDGVTNNYEAYDLDVSFRNTRGNPLIYLFYLWIKYETLVFEGILDPYMDFITENEIDYNTRIYRLVLDQQKRYVTMAASTGASFPINVPSGSIFDYNADKPYNSQNSEINIRFRSMGFTAFEDMVKFEFNSAVAIFNPGMKRVLDFDLGNTTSSNAMDKNRDDPNTVYKHAGMAKIPYSLATAVNGTDTPFYNLNHRAYPFINLATSELEWWVKESKIGTNVNAAMDSVDQGYQG